MPQHWASRLIARYMPGVIRTAVGVLQHPAECIRHDSHEGRPRHCGQNYQAALTHRAGNWYCCTLHLYNSLHIPAIVLPDHYLVVSLYTVLSQSIEQLPPHLNYLAT